MKNLNLIEIPGYGGEYLISKCGRVFSNKDPDKKPIEKSTYGNPDNPRITLWRNGNRYQPLVKTLIDRTFGASEKPAISDCDLRYYLKNQYQLSDSEISKIIAK